MIAAISARIVRRWVVLRVGAGLVGWGREGMGLVGPHLRYQKPGLWWRVATTAGVRGADQIID